MGSLRMYSPWTYRGVSTDSPLGVRRQSAKCLRGDSPSGIREMPVECPWAVRGLSMDSPSGVSEQSMDSPWDVHSKSWTIHILGLSMGGRPWALCPMG